MKISTAGVGSVNVPSGRNLVRVTMMGGGGGGGGGQPGSGNLSGDGGGGGGAGQIVQFQFYTTNASLSYSVGTGGNASQDQQGIGWMTPSQPGGDTTLNVTMNDVITAYGGGRGCEGGTSNGAGGDPGTGKPSMLFSTITFNGLAGTSGTLNGGYIFGTGGAGGGNGGRGGDGGPASEFGPPDPPGNGSNGANGMIYFEFI